MLGSEPPVSVVATGVALSLAGDDGVSLGAAVSEGAVEAEADADADAETEADAVGVALAAEHWSLVMVLLSKVTAPLRARSWPRMVAPVFAVIDVSAKRWPTNAEPVSRVAELPTCQNTLHA